MATPSLSFSPMPWMAAGVLRFKNEYPCPSHLATDLPGESLSLNKQASDFVLFLLPCLARAL
jgi:hypothetical protein